MIRGVGVGISKDLRRLAKQHCVANGDTLRVRTHSVAHIEVEFVWPNVPDPALLGRRFLEAAYTQAVVNTLKE